MRRHKSVLNYAARRRKPPGKLLLDVSYHYSAMVRLPEKEKRGRPDIAHFCLLEALGSPLARQGFLDVFAYTREGVSMHFAKGTRLPRNYDRFLGLMEQALDEGSGSRDGAQLLTTRKENLSELLRRINSRHRFLLRESAPRISLARLGENIHSCPDAVVMIGGFAHGDFDEETLRLADSQYSIYPESLEAWTVVSRLLGVLEEFHGCYT